MRNKTTILAVLLVACSVASVGAVEPSTTRVYIGAFTGPDTFINERTQMLFLEKLGELKAVSIVTSEQGADLVLSGAIRVDRTEEASVGGTGSATRTSVKGSSGTVETALISAKLVDKEGRIAFVTNLSWVKQLWMSSDPTEEAVVDVIQRMQKRLGWKK